MINNLLFVHNKPERFNIGDFLCTPQHYFDFDMRVFNNFHLVKNKMFNCIIGGGAYKDCAIHLKDKIPAQKIITWGIGESTTCDFMNNDTNYNKVFTLFTTRDKHFASDKYNYVPCVSVLSSMVEIDLPLENKLGIFLNHDNDITTNNSLQNVKSYCHKNDYIFATNSLSQLSLKKELRKVNKVVTNSYHIAYWSLLSGREVILLGYSSKFTELYNIFDLDTTKLEKYNREQNDQILDIVKQGLDNSNFVFLNDHKKYIKEFRKINVDFANKLVKKNVVKDAKLKHQNIRIEFLRDFKYRMYLKLKILKNKLKEEL